MLTNRALILKVFTIARNFLATQNIEVYGEARPLLMSISNWVAKEKNHNDLEMLAALAISGDYRVLREDEKLEIKEFYFPTIPVECEPYFSIIEFENGQHDEHYW